MFAHAVIGVNDVAKAKSFYDATLSALGHPLLFAADTRLAYGGATGALLVGNPIDGKPANSSNGSTIGFGAANKEAVDAWHAAGLKNGGTCEGPPGVREQTPGQPYAAYLRDPEGNKLVASCFGG